MEEENKQEVQPEVNQETKKVNLKSFDIKKYLPIIGIVVGVLLLIIILVSALGGGPKKAVKNYIAGLNSRNAKKVMKNVDFVGIATWGYSYDEDDFDEDDYEEFIENYEDILDELDEDELEEKLEDGIDALEDSFDYYDDDYKSYKMKVEEFKKVEKLGKNLYKVKAKISIKAKPEDKDVDEIDESDIITFVVYKNKLISLGGLGF